MWKITGRYDTYGTEMFKLSDRSDNEMVITGTNEELATIVAKDYVKSYRDLTLSFYQTNNKFRDEIRCNGGLIRCKEFSMMDAYSFHRNDNDLNEYYSQMRNSYINILTKLGLEFTIEKADSGEIGGSISEEFVIKTSEGNIEIGHIFQLGDKYSSLLDATFVDSDGETKNMQMGCYGIGITRLAQVLADVNRIGNNFNFNGVSSSFKYGIVVSNINDEDQLRIGSQIYDYLISKGASVYLDDRDVRIGQKLNDSDCIGTSYKILIGNNIKTRHFEIKTLSDSKWESKQLSEIYHL